MVRFVVFVRLNQIEKQNSLQLDVKKIATLVLIIIFQYYYRTFNAEQKRKLVGTNVYKCIRNMYIHYVCTWIYIYIQMEFIGYNEFYI